MRKYNNMSIEDMLDCLKSDTERMERNRPISIEEQVNVLHASVALDNLRAREIVFNKIKANSQMPESIIRNICDNTIGLEMIADYSFPMIRAYFHRLYSINL